MNSLICYSLLIAFCIACNAKPKEKATSIQNDTLTTPSDSTTMSTSTFIDFDLIEARRQRLLDTNYYFLGKLLDSSLQLAYNRGFEKSYAVSIDTSVFRFKNMSATITYGHLFSNDREHLIIKRFINEYADYETSLYNDIYLLDQKLFKKVAADTIDNGYGDEYFEDVNHDGYKDYIMGSYSGTGCCPRSLENGYVYNPQNGCFEPVDFFNRETDSLNPNFFETSYGLGNYINLYKYKWQGLKKVLLEEIYVTPTKEGEMNGHPTSYTRIFYPSGKKQIIKKLPDEYARLKMAEYISELED